MLERTSAEQQFHLLSPNRLALFMCCSIMLCVKDLVRLNPDRVFLFHNVPGLAAGRPREDGSTSNAGCSALWEFLADVVGQTEIRKAEAEHIP